LRLTAIVGTNGRKRTSERERTNAWKVFNIAVIASLVASLERKAKARTAEIVANTDRLSGRPTKLNKQMLPMAIPRNSLMMSS